MSDPLDAVWQVFIRDVNGAILDELDNWISLDIRMVFNGVGTWVLEMAADGVSGFYMNESRGIVVTRNDVTIFSGRIYTEFTRTAKTIRCGGLSDDYILNAPALPDPTNPLAPTTPYNVITGVASTVMQLFALVNIGSLAAVERRVANLTFAADPLLGGTMTGRGGGQSIIALLRELAATDIAGGLGFNVIQTDITGTRTFRVYQPQDKSAAVRFGLDLGTVSDFEDTKSAPEATVWYVQGGDGLGANNRTVIGDGDAGAIARWGRIEGIYVAQDVTDPGELNQKLAELLATSVTSRRTTVTPFEVPSQQFVDHWFLGDLVTFEVDTGAGGTESFVDLIREVHLSFTADRGVVITPMIGDAAATNDSTAAQHIAAVEARMGNIERNWTVPDRSIIPNMLTDSAVITRTIADDAVTAGKLDSAETPANHEVLGFDTTSGRLVWLAAGEITGYGAFVDLTVTGTTILGDNPSVDGLTVNAQTIFNGSNLYKNFTQYANASSTVVATFDPAAGAQKVTLGNQLAPGLYIDVANARTLVGSLTPLSSASDDKFTVVGGTSYFAGNSGPSIGLRYSVAETTGWKVGLSAAGSSSLLNFYDQSAGVILQAGPTGAALQFRVFGDSAASRMFVNSLAPSSGEVFRVASGSSRLEGKLTVTASGVDVTGASIFRNAVSFTAGGVDISGGLTINSSGIDVTGSSTFRNSVTVTSGGIGVTGSSAFNSGLSVSGGINVNNGMIAVSSLSLGFYGFGPVTQRTVTGSRASNAALQSLCSALAALGLIVDSTT